MNLWWGSVPRTKTTYWKIDASLSEVRERAEECKKNTDTDADQLTFD